MIRRLGMRPGDFVGSTAIQVVRKIGADLPFASPRPSRWERARPVMVKAGMMVVLGLLSPPVVRGVAASSGPRPKSSHADHPGARDLADKTRQELYQMARRSGIAGRSSMSKGDLIKELSK